MAGALPIPVGLVGRYLTGRGTQAGDGRSAHDRYLLAELVGTDDDQQHDTPRRRSRSIRLRRGG